MSKRLEQKVILITGGNGLLGKAIVQIVKEEGGTPIILDYALQNDTSEVQYKMDILNVEEIRSVLNAIVQQYGRIDGFVNNAYPKPEGYGAYNYESEPYEVWTKTIDAHMNGYHYCCKEVLAVMKQQGHGALVNLGSMYGIVGPDLDMYNDPELKFPASYCAFKGGIINYTRFLASYFTRYGIRVNAVSPGGIYNNHPEEFLQLYARKVLAQRMAKPEEIAKPIVFLLSDDASYIVGHNLVVDGGWTCI